MARPSRNTNQLLIQAARELIPETGCSGLSFRQVAKKAGVNLGMFHYHFKGREDFVRQVLSQIYEDFFSAFSLEIEGEEEAIARLRGMLLMVGKFSRDNRGLIVSLLRDLLNGDEEVSRFLKQNLGRHMRVLYKTIAQAKKEGALKDLPVPMILFHLVGSIGVPHLMADVLARAKVLNPLGLTAMVFNRTFLTDAAIATRVEFILGSVTVPTLTGG